MNIHWLSPGQPTPGEWCLKQRRTCLFLADYLPVHMIETGLPLFTSSLKWSFIVRLPFMALDSRIALLLAWGSCAHCVPHTHCKTQWIPIISAFHHSACLFARLSVRNVLLLSFSFHSRVAFSLFIPPSSFMPVIFSIAGSVLLSYLRFALQRPTPSYLSKG